MKLNKKIHKYTAILLASASFCSAAGATNISDALPIQFSSQSKPIQYQICGELLATMAYAGVKSSISNKAPDHLPLAVETGALSILALEQGETLTKTEKEMARALSKEIEQLDAISHIKTVVFCRNTVNGWVESGEIIPEALEQAVRQANSMLPQLVTKDLLEKENAAEPNNITK